MAKRTVKLTVKIDYLTSDQDWIEAFDEYPEEQLAQELEDFFGGLCVAKGDIQMKFRDSKVKKLKK